MNRHSPTKGIITAAALVGLVLSGATSAQAREPELHGIDAPPPSVVAAGVAAAAYDASLGQSGAAAAPSHRVELVAKGSARSNRTTVAAKIHIPPGGGVDWHTHPGQVYVIVAGGGELTLLTTGCRRLSQPTGTAFQPPRSAHTARNYSDEPLTLVATFHIRGPKPTVMVDPGRDAQLDERCGLEE